MERELFFCRLSTLDHRRYSITQVLPSITYELCTGYFDRARGDEFIMSSLYVGT